MSDPLIIFTPAGRRGRVAPGTTVLDAARELGVQIESICGGRLTCDKCLVRIEEGHFPKYGITSSGEHVTPVTVDEQEILDQQEPGLRLSCNARVQGDLLVFVPEGSRAQKQMIRKAAGERLIDVAPAVRQVYVEVDQAELGEHRGDWGRLQDALREQWELCHLSIDLPALRRLQAALREEEWAVTVTLWQDREVIDVQPGYEEGVYGLAVDIGSTTVAGYLCDLRTGEVLATESAMNPQITYGEDLMSRVSYATMNRQGLKKMHEAIIETLNRVAATAARQANLRARNIHEMVVVGNTTMMHIFLGIDPVELGQAPFALANRDAMDIKARELGLRLHAGANVHVLPAQAGHVGADNVGVLLAEEPHNQDEMWLVVDVGTNAEIVLGNRERLYSASSPTGPAFEGAQITHGQRATPGAIERVRIDSESGDVRFRVIGEERWSDEWQIGEAVPPEAQPRHLATGICGSGIIEVVAELFLAQVLLPNGRFNPRSDHPCLQWDGRVGQFLLATADQSAGGKPIVVTQNDVRNVQLAKGALYAGARLLMQRAGVEKVDRVLLAGAFGSYIDPRHAMI
ncbi:MAG: ASKHA domain-containing protein, partial [Chloroflexota bacterium]